MDTRVQRRVARELWNSVAGVRASFSISDHIMVTVHTPSPSALYSRIKILCTCI